MLTYRMKEKDRFYFKNLDRANEEELFLKAKVTLDKDPRIKFDKYVEIVELDIWKGKYKGIEFELCLDIDYGSFLTCKDEVILKEIEEILNMR